MSALIEQAKQFAGQVEDLLHTTVCLASSPVLDLQAKESSEEVSVVIRSSEKEPLLLTVNSKPILKLEITYRLRLGKDLGYLRTDESSFQVMPMGKKTAPLFRYDYIASPAADAIPVAHFQVHAHRDELLHAMYVSDRSRSTPAQKKRLDPAEPRGLHMIHFPLGGARFRPCLEDIIELLVNEFGLDTKPRWRERVEHGRIEWRRVQLAAAVRDDPETARHALAALGNGPVADESASMERIGRI